MKITIARIYLTEGKHIHKKILDRLHNEEKVKGVTMFRAVSGYGSSGVVHEATLVDLSLDLPLVIEFFDSDEKIKQVINDLKDLVEPDHVITFAAESH
jgi:PII-like signaling protein